MFPSTRASRPAVGSTTSTIQFLPPWVKRSERENGHYPICLHAVRTHTTLPSRHLLNGYRGSIFRGVKQPGLQSDYSTSCTFEIKTASSFNYEVLN